jgi:hypothetical protein
MDGQRRDLCKDTCEPGAYTRQSDSAQDHSALIILIRAVIFFAGDPHPTQTALPVNLLRSIETAISTQSE